MVARKDWRTFLVSQDNLIGAVAGFPDIPFRKQSGQVDGSANDYEAPNHYFHINDKSLSGPGYVAFEEMSCPLAVKTLAENYPGNPPFHNASTDADPELQKARFSPLGTSPWRIDQFQNLAIAELQSLLADKTIDPEKIKRVAYYMGLAAHYVGDHAVPWHADSDSHGMKAQHGNIHIYLEKCVDYFLGKADDPVLGLKVNPNPDLAIEGRVYALAQKRREEILKRIDPTASMIKIAILELEESLPEKTKFENLDQPDILVSKGEKKEKWVRTPYGESCPRFKKDLEDQLATAAAYVSILYDRTLPQGFEKIPRSVVTKTKPTEGDIQHLSQLDYPWFNCVAPPSPVAQKSKAHEPNRTTAGHVQ